MGLFTRQKPYTLAGHSRDYALSQRAPDDIAECYAEYIVDEDAAGAYGDPGANHATEWPAWSARNLAECRSCGSPWMLFVPCVESWECQDCPATVGPGEDGAT